MAPVIAGRFELDRVVGRGGMGEVWRALDRLTGRQVALKLTMADAELERFEREAQVLASLKHPGIVEHIDHGRENEQGYLAMEWLEGEDLRARLARGRLSVAEALELIRLVAVALGSAHAQGVVHRDLKPSNLFLVGGDLASVRLIDFGIAHVGGTTLTVTGAVVGTPGYMSPEQVSGEQDIDPRSDVFSLGCVLFECLQGSPPFAGEHPLAVLAKLLVEEAPGLSGLPPDAPPGVEALVALLLTKQREGRPADGGVVAGLIERVQRGEARPTVVSTALGDDEQRVTTVLLWRGEGAPVASDVTGDFGAPGAQAPRLTVPSELVVRQLADGTSLGLLSRSGTPRDQAQLACRLALSLVEKAPKIRVAIATDFAVSKARATVGPAIDRASAVLVRIQSGQIGVDEVSAALVRGRHEVARSPWGGLLTGASPAESVEGPPVLGRERELRLLEAALDDACAGRAGAVLVLGDAGSGKSSLGGEFRRRAARSPGTRVLWAAADTLDMLSPYALLRALLRVIRASPGSPPLDGREALVAIERGGALLHESVAFELAAWLREATRAGPVVVALDDLHWADEPSLRALLRAQLESEDLSLLLVLLGRPQAAERFDALLAPLAPVEVRLRALPPRVAGELVERLAGGALPQEQRAEIVERGQGNPYLLEELVRAAASGPREATPTSVLGVVQTGVEQLSAPARRALRAASVIGQRFSLDDTIAILGEGADTRETVQALDEAIRADVIRADDRGGHAFRHALTRDAVYAMLPDDERADAHGRAARWLEQRGGASPALLAHHHGQAGDPDRAVPCYVAAAREAAAAGDRVAIERFEIEVAALAPDHPARIDLLQMLAFHRFGGSPEARWQAARLALSLASPSDSRRPALFTAMAEADPSEETFAAAIDGISALPCSEASLEALIILTSIAIGAGVREPPALRELLARHEASLPAAKANPRLWMVRAEYETALSASGAAKPPGNEEEARFLRFVRSYLLVHLGRPHEALQEAEQAVPLVRSPRSRAGAGLLLCRGNVADALGDVAAAFEHFDGAQRALLAISGPRDREVVRLTLRRSEQLLAMGRHDEAAQGVALVEPGLATLAGLRPLADAVLASASLAAGQKDEAGRAARRGLSFLRPGWHFEGGPYRPRSVLARVLLACGARDEALLHARTALDEVDLFARRIATPQRRQDFFALAPGVASALSLGQELGLALPIAG